MSGPLSEFVALAVFLVAGWVTLWPLRTELGTARYHIAAIPIGLLSAPVAASFSSAVGRPLDWLSIVVGAAAMVAGVRIMARVAGVEQPPTFGIPDAKSHLLAATALGAATAFFGWLRLVACNSDSFMAFWPMGVELSRYGAFTRNIVGTRSPLIPSVSAVHVVSGSDWAYVIFPVLAVTLLLWLALSLREGPLATARPRTGWWIVGATTAFLLIEPSFLYHAIFAHSHMYTAVFLLIAITTLVRLVWSDEENPSTGHLMLAGLATAGVALTRPDGLAYQFVPVALALAVLTVSRIDLKRVAAYFGPWIFTVYVVFAGAYIEMGLWRSSKLGGRKAALILFIMALAVAGPWIIAWLDRRLPFRVSGGRFLPLFVSGCAVLAAAVLVLRWEKAVLALTTARINAFEEGGYGYLWYALFALLVLSVLTGDALRSRSWTSPMFLAIALFLVVAFIVHGTSHEGRIGHGDSLNRVTFHLIPLMVWYVGAVVARILGDPAQTPSNSRIQSHSA